MQRRMVSSGRLGSRYGFRIEAAFVLVTVLSASSRVSAAEDPARPMKPSTEAPTAPIAAAQFSSLSTSPGQPPTRATDGNSVASWAIPTLAAVLGAAGIAWGVHLLTSHEAPSCDRNPISGCTNGPNTRMEGADLTTAGALILLGSSAYLVRLWTQPLDGGSNVVAHGVVLQAHF
jgi:hypothetical protein